MPKNPKISNSVVPIHLMQDGQTDQAISTQTKKVPPRPPLSHRHSQETAPVAPPRTNRDERKRVSAQMKEKISAQTKKVPPRPPLSYRHSQETAPVAPPRTNRDERKRVSAQMKEKISAQTKKVPPRPPLSYRHSDGVLNSSRTQEKSLQGQQMLTGTLVPTRPAPTPPKHYTKKSLGQNGEEMRFHFAEQDQKMHSTGDIHIDLLGENTFENKLLYNKERLAVEAGLSFDEHATKLQSKQAEPDEERHIVSAEIDELKSLSDKVDDRYLIHAQYSRDVAEEWLMQRIWRKVVQFLYDLSGIDESVTLERKLADSLKVVEAAQNESKSMAQYASTDAMEPDIEPRYNPLVSLSSSIPSSVSGPALHSAAPPPPAPPPPPPPLPGMSAPLPPPPPSGAAQSTVHKQGSFDMLAGIKNAKLKKVPSPDQNQAKSRGPSGSSGGIDLSSIQNEKERLKVAPTILKTETLANNSRDLLMSGIMDKANKRDTNKINIEEAIRRNKEQIDQQKQNKEESAELKDIFKRALDARRIKIEDADSRDQDSDDGWDDESKVKKIGPQTKPKSNVGSATSTMAAGAQNKKGTPPAP